MKKIRGRIKNIDLLDQLSDDLLKKKYNDYDFEKYNYLCFDNLK